MRRRHLLLLSALGVGVVLGTAHPSAVQEPHLAIEAHRITEKLHMLVSDVDIIITGTGIRCSPGAIGWNTESST